MPEKSGLYSKLNVLIISFLVIQVVTLSISIAVSSIAFGLWGCLWIIQLIAFRDEPSAAILWNEIKWIVFFLAVYAAAEVLSRVFAVFPDGALIGLKRLLLFLVFFAMIFKIPDRKALHFVLFVVLCMLMAVSVYELINYVILAPELIPEKGFGETRIDYLLYPLSGGEIKLMMIMTILPMFLIKERFFVERKYLIIISLPVIISMLLTQSRNVFLALMICLVIFGILKNWKVLGAGIVIAVILLYILPVEVTGRFTSIFDLQHGSNDARLTMWGIGWKIFLSSPFIGVGDNHLMDVYVLFKNTLSEWEHSHLHSNIFMVLATTGVMGFIGFAGFMLSIFLKQLKYYKEINNESDKALILGSILMFIAFNICGIFEWNFGDHEVLSVFLFLISVPFIIFKLTPKKVINK
jgi:putative inorganic carbon (HCO3(-)) transporter